MMEDVTLEIERYTGPGLYRFKAEAPPFHDHRGVDAYTKREPFGLDPFRVVNAGMNGSPPLFDRDSPYGFM